MILRTMPSQNHGNAQIYCQEERVWASLKALSGNENFNPLVISSKLDGFGVGTKPICYVSIDEGKTASETVEKLTMLDENSRTMQYKVMWIKYTLWGTHNHCKSWRTIRQKKERKFAIVVW